MGGMSHVIATATARTMNFDSLLTAPENPSILIKRKSFFSDFPPLEFFALITSANQKKNFAAKSCSNDDDA